MNCQDEKLPEVSSNHGIGELTLVESEPDFTPLDDKSAKIISATGKSADDKEPFPKEFHCDERDSLISDEKLVCVEADEQESQEDVTVCGNDSVPSPIMKEVTDDVSASDNNCDMAQLESVSNQCSIIGGNELCADSANGTALDTKEKSDIDYDNGDDMLPVESSPKRIACDIPTSSENSEFQRSDNSSCQVISDEEEVYYVKSENIIASSSSSLKDLCSDLENSDVLTSVQSIRCTEMAENESPEMKQLQEIELDRECDELEEYDGLIGESEGLNGMSAFLFKHPTYKTLKKEISQMREKQKILQAEVNR